MAVTARLSSRTFSSISVSKISTFARGRHSYAYIASASLLRKKAHSRQWCPALSLKVVATSEHWWEEEEEFDSLTDALARKKIVILIPPVNEEPTDQGQAALAILRGYLHSVNFICGFCGTAEAEFAQALWQGRDKPPLFLKMRTRYVMMTAPFCFFQANTMPDTVTKKSRTLLFYLLFLGDSSGLC